jgi:hypothetical protein
MVVLRPKVDKPEKEMSPHDYDIKKVAVDMNSLPQKTKYNGIGKHGDMVERILFKPP